jgi:hypothetical protein
MQSVLKRGGWVQMLEWDLKFRSDSGQMDDLQCLRRWKTLYSESLGMTTSAEGRKDREAPGKLETFLRTAGFTSISSETREIPASNWSAGRSRLLFSVV